MATMNTTRTTTPETESVLHIHPYLMEILRDIQTERKEQHLAPMTVDEIGEANLLAGLAIPDKQRARRQRNEKALYRAGDTLVLKDDQTQICHVTVDQRADDAFVQVQRANQGMQELIREDDMIPLGLREVQA